METETIFKSDEGSRIITEHYENYLESFPFDIERKYVETSYRTTHVLVAGPLKGKPILSRFKLMEHCVKITLTDAIEPRSCQLMKKLIVFAISFILLFSLSHIFSGFFLTVTYKPNIEEAWHMSGNLSQEIVIKSNSSFLLTLFLAFLSATIAYYIPKKFIKNNN
ncbi:hypothetical protein [Pseudogracilibacillus sp. SO30301A]|uniref:hypothetical protein n=1 Tax=Pseudogracilibacillus sp. SO30301A TaxID=3098291 RepID=UPI00300E3FCF